MIKFDPHKDALHHYYLHVHFENLPNQCIWVAIEQLRTGTTVSFKKSIIHAEAFTSEEAIRTINIINLAYPTAAVIAIQCDTRQLIPDELRNRLKWKI